MSSSAELHKVLRDALRADLPLMAMVNSVQDSVVGGSFAEPKQAYISFGNSDATLDDAECINGVEITQQIDCWSRKPGLVNAKIIVDRIRYVIANADLEMTENAMCFARAEFYRTFLDPDGKTAHGVVNVTAYIEEPNDE